MRNQKGFTLIELMIVVAILGILAALALSAYQSHNRPVVMGHNGVSVPADVPVTYLVCKEGGFETLREPAIPGARWDFEGGSYVTLDANGNPRTLNTAGKDCTIET